MDNQQKQSREKLDELKNDIKERLARPTFVEDLAKQSDQKSEKKAGWILKEIKDDPGGFVFLFVSSLFTSMLGLYLGLAPHLTPDPIHPERQLIVFNTDFGHVVTAILYMISFVLVTEIAFFYSRHKFHVREEGNGNQLWTMWAAMALAFVSIIVTGGAGGTVIASTLGFLSEFAQVPPSLQKYLVWIVPALFGFYLILHTVYRLTSQKSRAERIAQQVKENQELEHKMLMDQLELEGEEEIMIEEIEAYKDLVRRGKLSRGQARAALRAGKSIPELEKELKADLDDDGSIGKVTPRLPSPAPDPALPARKAKRYTLSEILDYARLSPDQAREMIRSYGLTDSQIAYGALYRADYLPQDLTEANFAELYNELLAGSGIPVDLPARNSGPRF